MSWQCRGPRAEGSPPGIRRLSDTNFAKAGPKLHTLQCPSVYTGILTRLTEFVLRTFFMTTVIPVSSDTPGSAVRESSPSAYEKESDSRARLVARSSAQKLSCVIDDGPDPSRTNPVRIHTRRPSAVVCEAVATVSETTSWGTLRLAFL